MFSSIDVSSPASRSMSIIREVNTLVIEPILNPVLAVGGPLEGSAVILILQFILWEILQQVVAEE